ncbi:MAG: cyclase [Dehalococcoidia bacterium]|nr:cyclase [Dehalococcoidia bacterium]
MARIDKSIEVEVPVQTAYNQWTQFEEFPRFMEGIHEVQQLGDERLFWAAELSGQRKEWVCADHPSGPGRVLAWESEGGAMNGGTIVFHPKDAAKTEIEVHMDYEPEDFKEQIGGALGFVSRRVEGDLKRFKEFIEERGSETGAWRGEIIHGAPGDESSQLRRSSGASDAEHGEGEMRKTS